MHNTDQLVERDLLIGNALINCFFLFIQYFKEAVFSLHIGGEWQSIGKKTDKIPYFNAVTVSHG